MEAVFILLLRVVLAYVIAEHVGTKRKIGFGWSFAFCLFLGLIGVCITLFSDKVDEDKFQEIKKKKL